MLMDPATLRLHRQWTFWAKHNNNPWEQEMFGCKFVIETVEDMWRLLNNIPVQNMTGRANLFFMADGMLPLWEQNMSTWAKGGCWSTIIKGTPWQRAMFLICSVVFGETVFDEQYLRGICIIPVTGTHCIVKIWSTIKRDEDGSLLRDVTKELNSCPPRFKSFVA